MNKNLLKYHIAKNDMSLEQFSKVLGINVSTLSRKLNGESDFTRNEIVLIKIALKLSADDIDTIFLFKNLRKRKKRRNIMNELIPIKVKSDDSQFISGRDLHMFLEIGTQYTKWFERMCEYGFSENDDFRTVSQKRLTAQGNESTFLDHELTIEMAKQLCMLARNDKGKQAREYFIQIERDWNSPEKVMGRALKIANNVINNQKITIAQQNQQLQELQPKATYYDLVLQNTSLLSITQIAKDFGLSARRLNRLLEEEKVQYKQSGQWFLYQKYADKGYTSSKTTVLDADRSVMHTYWTQQGRLFIYSLLKNKGHLPLIEQMG